MNQLSPARTFIDKAAETPQRDRYSSVAIAFHWAIAASILIQLALGFHMGDLEGLGRSVLLQIHKTVGVSVLLLTLGRLAWRAMNPPPPHADTLTKVERLVSHGVHMGFYAALFLLPLTGWAMVSMQRPGGMKILGGLLTWPAFPGAALVPGKGQDIAADVLDRSHTVLVWVMIGLLALHIAGALKHHFISKDRTLARMAPGVKPGSFTDKRLLSIPAVVILVAALVYLPKLPTHFDRPKPKDLASADIYRDIVGPSLDRRCGFCHSEDVSKGGLSLTSYDGVMQGGRDGKAVVPGHPERSELYRRITLPVDHAQYMPKDGKPPLGKSEVAAIQWWIAQGAPSSAKIGALKLTPDAKAALGALLGGDQGGDDDQSGLPQGPALPAAPAADPGAIAKLVADGFIVRPAQAKSNLLVVDFSSPKPVTADAMADLAKLGPQVVSLNLRHAGIADAMLKPMAGFPNLQTLRLEENPITDAAAKDIAGIKTLTYLNLTNTKVTDAGFAEVATLPRLQRLYLWGAAVTPAAVDRVKAARKDLILSTGLTAKDVKVETAVMAPSN